MSRPPVLRRSGSRGTSLASGSSGTRPHSLHVQRFTVPDKINIYVSDFDWAGCTFDIYGSFYYPTDNEQKSIGAG